MSNQCSVYMITDQKEYGRELQYKTQPEEDPTLVPGIVLFNMTVKDYLTEGWVQEGLASDSVIELIQVNAFTYMDLRLEEAGYHLAERYEYKNGILYYQELPDNHNLWQADRDSGHFWEDIQFEVTQQYQTIKYRNTTHMINYFQGTSYYNIAATWELVMPVVERLMPLGGPDITCKLNEALLLVDVVNLFNTVADILETYIDEGVRYHEVQRKALIALESSANFLTLDYVMAQDTTLVGPDLVDCVESVDSMWFVDNEDLRIKILTKGRP